MTSEDDVREVLLPAREAKLYLAFSQAWDDVQEDRHRYAIWPRTRAGMVFERLAVRLQENFADDPGVRFVFADETVKIIFDDRLVVRCKKANSQGLGQNIQTYANDLFCEQGSLDFGPFDKVEVVYVLDDYATSIKRIMVQARDGNVRLWAYQIDDSAIPAAAHVTPFPTPPAPPSPDLSELVQPRAKPAAKDESGKK